MLAEAKTPLLEKLRFLNHAQIKAISELYGTPVFVYSEHELLDRAKDMLAFNAPYGLTVRYAMKANPLRAILKTFNQCGIHIDASSGYEAERAIQAGIEPCHIMVTSQEVPRTLDDLVKSGVKFNATSLNQLETYGRSFPGTSVAIRVNAGVGSGYRRQVSVAGPNASFGIWHEHQDQARAIAKKYGLTVETIHSHIGCGVDPLVWREVAKLTLKLLENFPSVTNLNLGGGFAVARMSNESSTDIVPLSREISVLLSDFAKRTGRKLHLEIEPGTFLTANAGTLISQIQDMTTTGASGSSFIKLDTGMNDIMRPAMHAAQHPIIVINDGPSSTREYVVVGHNCESSDLLTPAPGDSEVLLPRLLREAHIGDRVAIEGVGAYCSSMRLIGYNSFPTPNEVMLMTNGEVKLINRRQDFTDFAASEIS